MILLVPASVRAAGAAAAVRAAVVAAVGSRECITGNAEYKTEFTFS